MTGSALAAQTTVSCSFVSSTDDQTKYVLADQFVFDSVAQTLDMRVAKSTMNWLFVTQKTEFLDDVFSVRIDKSGLVAAAGLRNTVPVAFRLTEDGTLDFTYMSPTRSHRIRWKCDRTG